jgi:two-component sensor histidine kinase
MAIRFPRSLRARIALLLGLATLPIGAVAIWDAIVATGQARREIELAASDAVTLAASRVQTIVIDARATTTVLARMNILTDAHEPACNAALARVARARSAEQPISVADADGVILCASRPDLIGQTVPGRTASAMAARRGGFYLEGPRPAPILEDQIVSAILPLVNGEDDVIGSIAVGIPYRSLSAPVIDRSGLAGAGIAIVNRSGRVARLASAAGGGDAGLWDWAQQRIAGDPALLGRFSVERGPDGADHAFAAAPIYGDDLTMVAVWPGASLLAPIESRLLSGMLLPVAMWLVGMLVAWFATDRAVTRPVIYLGRIARLYAGGHFSVRARRVHNAADELRDLGATLDRMASDLQERRATLDRAFREQSLLLSEVHHRVNNNLQTVNSLLRLYRRLRPGADGQAVSTWMEDRLFVLAIVYRCAYESIDLVQVSLDSFFRNILDAIDRTLSVRRHLTISHAIPAVPCPTGRAVPLALFAMESALGLAVDGQETAISIEMSGVDDGWDLSIRRRTPRADEKPTLDQTTMIVIRAYGRQAGGIYSGEAATAGLSLRIPVAPAAAA